MLYKYKIGKDGIYKNNNKIGEWKDIIGVTFSRFSPKIFYYDGKYEVINERFNPLGLIKDYIFYDYGDKNVDDGEYEELNDWDTIAKRIVYFIKRYGAIYIDEYSGLYLGVLGYFGISNKDIKFSKEERKSALIVRIAMLYFILVFFLLMIFSNNSKSINCFELFVILSLIVFWAYALIRYKRKEKIEIIYERYKDEIERARSKL